MDGTKVKDKVTYVSGIDEIERREIWALEKAAEELGCKKKPCLLFLITKEEWE